MCDVCEATFSSLVNPECFDPHRAYSHLALLEYELMDTHGQALSTAMTGGTSSTPSWHGIPRTKTIARRS